MNVSKISDDQSRVGWFQGEIFWSCLWGEGRVECLKKTRTCLSNIRSYHYVPIIKIFCLRFIPLFPYRCRAEYFFAFLLAKNPKLNKLKIFAEDPWRGGMRQVVFFGGGSSTPKRMFEIKLFRKNMMNGTLVSIYII